MLKRLFERSWSAVESMNVGDKQLFLTGTQHHKTRTLIERKQDCKWRVTYFDSAKVSVFGKNKMIRKFRVTDKESLKESLAAICKTKFSKQSKNQKNQ